ncbi:MAG: Gfo/Idh/MocA family oxidoreductase [Betaproteobacteria bacterium]
MTPAPIRIGVAGLGRAFTLMLPTFIADPRVTLAAATDARPSTLASFGARFGARMHVDVEALCADRDIDAVYVATPHQYHAQHTILAATHGKHVLVEKPMALSVDECEAMIAAAERAGVQLVVGHSHSFDAPVRRARELIDAGTIGRVRMVNAQYYTDFLYRLRRPEELDTRAGGGVLWSQAAHQVDIVRMLGGGNVERVRALTGAWDAARATEGAYAALLTFADGAFASLLYSGYAHFDSDIFCDDVSELGLRKDRARYGDARRTLARAGAPAGETAAKAARNDATLDGIAPHAAPTLRQHEHFGVVVVSGERGDLRLLPGGVEIYGDDTVRLDAMPASAIPRVEVIDELYAAVREGRAPLHDGRWSMATLEVCMAMLQSARERGDVVLHRQVAL